ncbi:MAG: hypothetical protein ABL901_03510 [Hyphomicrobiaceae bacterium]
MSSARTKLPSVALPVEPVPHVTVLVRADDGNTNLPAEAFDGLPGLLADIARAAGLQAALDLANARGGNRVYIPAYAPDDHWLVATVGRVAADAICTLIKGRDGGEIELPRGPSGLRAETWRRMYAMINDGASSQEITRRLGISRDMVKYHRSKMRTQEVTSQMSMFALLESKQED